MKGLSWADASQVHWMWGVLLWTVLLIASELRKRRELAAFLSPVMQGRLCEQVPKWRGIVRALAFGLAGFFMVLAVMRPQTEGDIETLAGTRLSADIVVALDVSKSMLADDAAPTRLARAKAEVSALHDALPGYRFGLVAFAGGASLISPLTPDAGFFRMMLRGADHLSVSRGGTKVGEALRVAVDAFGEGSSGPRLILLITDGEAHDDYAVDAAKKAKEKGIPVVTVGFGSEGGSQIRIVDPKTGAKQALIDPATNQPVVSKLNGELLRKIALESDGAYVPAGVSALDLEAIVSEHIEPLVRPEAEAGVRIVPRDLYPFGVLLSMLSLFLALVLGTRGRTRW